MDRLLPLMQESFPKLGLVKEDCMGKRWIEAVLYSYELPYASTLRDLVGRNPNPSEAEDGKLVFTSYGGRIGEIPGSEILFPRRAENIYEIQRLVGSSEE
ncbi:UNVERIFIED_CONTAM: Berberine bridge enzyme-like 13 [Sesamum angustifolium]|uniref:Berberine bridge enzyme-like 13 n=1 Tax=Sesamum angustifolium TaxID=2727405 RepID=A0AAW2LXJ4_9LAMI